MAQIEPQSANDYDVRTTAAVRSVFVEIGHILGAFEGRYAVIGGAVPWLLLSESDMRHIGTGDVDLGLDAEALGGGEYAQLVQSLQDQGYKQRVNLRRFQLARTVPSRDGGRDIDVIVDFLMPRDAEIAKNTSPLVRDFAVQRADGVELALRFYNMVSIDGEMPDGGRNRVRLPVASIPALLAMKGYAITNRLKHKDAYDIYFCIRNFPDGLGGLVAAVTPLLGIDSARSGYLLISEKFRSVDDFGPTSVRKFVEDSDALGGRTADQWQQDAFGQVNAWLTALGLR